MKSLLALLIAKIIRIIGKIFKKGSSLPGQIALKIDPNILSKIKLPKYVIAVSGSNGKTSTTEMIKEVLIKAGYKVAHNYEGSNQIEGVTTLLLDDVDLSLRCKSDVILLESDERYARYTFNNICPTHFIITNLYRDQLTRNGNPEIIFNLLKEAIKEETTLLLNADDPLVSNFGYNHSKTIYYSIDKYTNDNNIGVYDDGICPRCKNKFKYEYRHYSHIGKYECLNCGYKHPNSKYKITNVDLNIGKLKIDNEHDINISLRSIYNAYNILSTYSLCKELNIDSNIIIDSLNNYVLKNGRVTNFKLANKQGTLLISKHENSISYNQSMNVVRNDTRNVSVVVLVDAISRKYFTSETSWLFDIDFNILNSTNVKSIVLAGLYAYDLASRFEYTSINKDIIKLSTNIDNALNMAINSNTEYIYVLTCFSDMNKIFKRVEVIN